MEPFILDRRLCLVFALLTASPEEGEAVSAVFCTLLPAGLLNLTHQTKSVQFLLLPPGLRAA